MAAVDARNLPGRGGTQRAPRIHRFCVSHKKPVLPDSWYDDCIALGDYQPDSAFHVSRLDRFWHEARPIAYGAAGTHTLPIAIERFAGDADLIEVSCYRKRILPFPIGLECPLYGRALSFPTFDKEAELAEFMSRTDLEFLVAQPLYFEASILGQYAACHHRKDILDYTSLAIEMGVLDEDSASEFLATKHFIPGGVEVGVFPRTWLMHALSGIERVGRRFVCQYGSRLKKYDDYQIRAVQFLSERLGSFLLIRRLTEKYSGNIPADVFGHMTIIAEDESSYFVGVSNRSKN